MNATADAYFLTPTEGGRTTPMKAGFREVIPGGHPDEINTAWVGIEDCEEAKPGQRLRISLRPLRPDSWKKKWLLPGAEVTICEGARPIGRAVITGDAR
ncbi:MAG: hypothetical protein JO247_19680 [Chloroflexi bacterium]|nr:hypothetical protein [Chloroflexota bacterium]